MMMFPENFCTASCNFLVLSLWGHLVKKKKKRVTKNIEIKTWNVF